MHIKVQWTTATGMAASNLLRQFNLKNEWIEDYKERFDFYCVARGVGEGKQKVHFLTSIGQQTYAKLKKWIWPSTFFDLTLAQIVACLREHTTEETVEIAEH